MHAVVAGVRTVEADGRVVVVVVTADAARDSRAANTATPTASAAAYVSGLFLDISDLLYERLRGALSTLGAQGTDLSVAWRRERAEAIASTIGECVIPRLWGRRLPRVGADVKTLTQLMDSTRMTMTNHRASAWRLIARLHDQHRCKRTPWSCRAW